MNRPTRNYDYNRPGVAMLTLKANPGIWFCRITQTSFFGERYKPGGQLFDLCAQGRLLELSVAGAFPRFARLDRAACLTLNAVTRDVSATQWPATRE